MLLTLLVSVVLCLLDETGAEARLHGCTDRQRFENEWFFIAANMSLECIL